MSETDKTYLFLDESGDHSLDVIDSQYPMFVLGGVIMSSANYGSVNAQWKRMRKNLFGLGYH
jgi:hypothetical protein